MRRALPFAIIGAVLVLAAGGGLLLFRAKYSSTPIKIAAGKPGGEPSHLRGSAQARVTLEEFGDFQCMPCGILAATLLKVEHDYATSVRVIFRHFPLSNHAHAFTAACAAEAAGLQGRFWEMHDLLFQNARHWSKGDPLPFFAGYAATLGLDVERFKKDMESEQVKTRIRQDQERGVSIAVDRTPTLFLNGVQVPFTSLDAADLRRTIDAELSGGAPTPVPPGPGSNLQTPTPGPPK
ncbi:MAG TPA: thioredoxin domain-containing protein [Chthoniobacterales bacterium]|nr:thioredoxin domain-containing protein [Chthoniobacterales bacterium]